MTRCAPCTKFAEYSEVLPGPPYVRSWLSKAELIASARSGCDLCTLCWQYIDNSTWKAETGLLSLTREYDAGSRRTSFRLTSPHKFSALNLSSDDDNEFKPSSEINNDLVSQARRLLWKCRHHHGSCNQPLDSDLRGDDAGSHFTARHSLPRRLLDLCRPSGVFVIDVEDWISSGALSITELSRYCALSYRWGVTAHNSILKAPFSHEIEIDESSMPQTFKDAIKIARGLDIRFLWIDGLCIVQPSASGDDTDWNAEGPRMGTIYSNATCTIAATCADDITEGFLSKVGSERICAVPCKVHQHKRWGTILTAVLKPAKIDFANAVTLSTLNKRGWVTQERLLSRRILHFTLQGIIWECHKAKTHGDSAVAGVTDYTSVLSHIRSPLASPLEPDTNDWFEFVSQYSTTDFTNMGDRLIALSSLANVLHHRAGYTNMYCAGIWKNRLVEQLLWFSQDAPHAQSAKRLTTVPTWTWASSSGSIAYYTCLASKESFPPFEIMPSVHVVNVDMTLAQPSNPYGNVKEGRIELLAQVLTVSIWTRNAHRRSLDSKASEDKAFFRSVHWDESQEPSVKKNVYQIIPMYPVSNYTAWRIDPQYAALIVEPVSPVETVGADRRVCVYRRIGLVVDGHAPGLLDGLIAGRSRYNFGVAEQRLERVVLV